MRLACGPSTLVMCNNDVAARNMCMHPKQGERPRSQVTWKYIIQTPQHRLYVNGSNIAVVSDSHMAALDRDMISDRNGQLPRTEQHPVDHVTWLQKPQKNVEFPLSVYIWSCSGETCTTEGGTMQDVSMLRSRFTFLSARHNFLVRSVEGHCGVGANLAPFMTPCMLSRFIRAPAWLGPQRSMLV